MYNFEDTLKLHRLARIEKDVTKEFPELSDINNILCAILYRTAFYSNHIDDINSHYYINYIINLLKSIDKEDIKLVDHHLIDSITYPYVFQVSEVVDGLKSVFYPKNV